MFVSQMFRPPQRRPLHPARPRNPTASCSAPPPAATSNPQVHKQHNTHTHLYSLLQKCCNMFPVFLSGSIYTLGESGRSESRTTLRSPKEERPEITQLRKVNHSIHTHILVQSFCPALFLFYLSRTQIHRQTEQTGH